MCAAELLRRRVSVAGYVVAAGEVGGFGVLASLNCFDPAGMTAVNNLDPVLQGRIALASSGSACANSSSASARSLCSGTEVAPDVGLHERMRIHAEFDVRCDVERNSLIGHCVLSGCCVCIPAVAPTSGLCGLAGNVGACSPA